MNEISIVEKWEKNGMLTDISDETLKFKLANACELAANMLLKQDSKTNNIEVTIFPALYRIIAGSNGMKTLHSDIEITEGFIGNFINYIRECVDVEKIEKWIPYKVIDIEADLLALMCDMFVRSRNKLFMIKNEIKNETI